LSQVRLTSRAAGDGAAAIDCRGNAQTSVIDGSIVEAHGPAAYDCALLFVRSQLAVAPATGPTCIASYDAGFDPLNEHCGARE
jgi:hypothetical protein